VADGPSVELDHCRPGPSPDAGEDADRQGEIAGPKPSHEGTSPPALTRSIVVGVLKEPGRSVDPPNPQTKPEGSSSPRSRVRRSKTAGLPTRLCLAACEHLAGRRDWPAAGEACLG